MLIFSVFSLAFSINSLFKLAGLNNLLYETY